MQNPEIEYELPKKEVIVVDISSTDPIREYALSDREMSYQMLQANGIPCGMRKEDYYE